MDTMGDSEYRCTGCGRDPRECNILPCLQAEALLKAEPSEENAKALQAMWPGTTITMKDQE